jgi:AGZA family xanthine/uracil permease-like MFS transporter
LVGLMMMSNVWKIDFFDYKESIPAFICMIFMPLAYSISDGILLGHLSYVIINMLSGNRKNLTTGMYVLAVIFLIKFLV